MLKHVTGNLIDLAEDGHFDVIFHCANCFNTLGGGIAKEIRLRYPQAAQVDAETIHGDYNKLGNWTQASSWTSLSSKYGTDPCQRQPFIIINAYAQFNMSTGEDVFEYTAFELILQKLVHAYGDKRIGLPYVGMGLARGNETVIMEQINWFADKVAKRGGQVTLVKFG